MTAPGSSLGAAHAAGQKEGAARTVAQLGALVIGGSLIAAGVLGFFFGGSGFETGSNVEGENFIIFEVNGWHNIVHIATGAFLVLMAAKARAAVIGLVVFAAAYAIVTVWGFIDGNDVINVVAINAADNWLHVGLIALALAAALMAGGLGAAARKDQKQVRRDDDTGGRTA